MVLVSISQTTLLLAMEQWADIDEISGYAVSTKGRVMGKRGTNLLAIQTRRDGYRTVTLYKDKKTYGRQVHRLVALAFLPNPEKHPVVHHKDGVRSNNCIENLEWVSYAENAQQKLEEAEENVRRSRSVIQIHPSGDYTEWGSIKAAASFLEIRSGDIGDCCNGKISLAGG